MASKIKFRNKKNRKHIITVDIVTERSLFEFLDNSDEWVIYKPTLKPIFSRG